jgi:hypothetical protein
LAEFSRKIGTVLAYCLAFAASIIPSEFDTAASRAQRARDAESPEEFMEALNEAQNGRRIISKPIYQTCDSSLFDIKLTEVSRNTCRGWH